LKWLNLSAGFESLIGQAYQYHTGAESLFDLAPEKSAMKNPVP
jgi:hypothetical protein